MPFKAFSVKRQTAAVNIIHYKTERMRLALITIAHRGTKTLPSFLHTNTHSTSVTFRRDMLRVCVASGIHLLACFSLWTTTTNIKLYNLLPRRLRSTEQAFSLLCNLRKGSAYPTQPRTQSYDISKPEWLFKCGGRSTFFPCVTPALSGGRLDYRSRVKRAAKAMPVFHLLFYNYVKPSSEDPEGRRTEHF